MALVYTLSHAVNTLGYVLACQVAEHFGFDLRTCLAEGFGTIVIAVGAGENGYIHLRVLHRLTRICFHLAHCGCRY